MKYIFKVIILLACLNSSHLQAQDLFIVEILNFGIFTTVKGNKIVSESSLNGERWSGSSNLKHLTTTVNIPAIIDNEFGVEFKLKSKYEISLARVKYIWTPSSPITQENGKVFKKSESEKSIPIGSNQYAGYVLNLKEELTPENWMLQVYSGEVLLFKKVFYLKHAI